MAGNKITAHFGADVSEVEAKMMAATRATKYYENAVKQVNKSEAAAAAGAGGGFMGQLGKKAPQVLEKVKSLAGALGAAGAAAGLVPGLGVAAIGVAAVVAGVKKIRDYYAETAANAEKVKDFMMEAGKRIADRRMERASDSEKLKILEEQADAAKLAWRISVENGKSDVEILEKRKAYDDARDAADKQREANRKSASEKTAQQAERERKLAEQIAKKQAEINEEKFGLEYINRRILELEKDSVDSSLSKEQRLQAQLDLIDMQAKAQKIADDQKAKADKAASERAKDDAEKKKEAAKKEAAAAEELAKLKYELAWKNATFEQRLVQVVKEGREAQAKVEKDASAENLLALEKARNKYRDLIDEAKNLRKEEIKGDKSGKGDKPEFTTRSGRVKVSAEDRARSEATRQRNKEFDEVAKSQRISMRDKDATKAGAGKREMGETEKLLAQIERHLKPQ